MENEQIKIILVDDHQVVRGGTKAVLIPHKNIKVLAEASNGEELFKLLESHKPDIVLLDISLPKMDGIEITRILQKNHPEIKVIIFSGKTDEDSIFDALGAGAKSFLPKDTIGDEIVEAINEVSKGNEYLSFNIPNTILIKY